MPQLRGAYGLKSKKGFAEVENDFAAMDTPEGFDSYMNTQPDVTGSQSLMASVELSAQQAPTWGLIPRVKDYLLHGENGKQLSLDQLKEKYPDIADRWKEPENEGYAEILAKKKRRSAELERRINEGPQSAAYSVGRFVGAMVPHALDPLNIATGIAAETMIASRLMAGTLQGGKVAKALGVGVAKAERTTGQAAANMLVSGAIGNIPAEAAAFGVSQLDQEEYTTADFVMNTAGAAAGFATLRYLGGKVFDFFPPKQREMIIKNNTARLMDDKKPSIDPHIENKVNETNGNSVPFNVNENSNAALSVKDLYIGTTQQFDSPSVKTDQGTNTRNLHTDYKMSDSQDVANGIAGSGINDADGSVFHVKAQSELNLVRLDDMLPDNVAAVINAVTGIEATGKKGVDIFDEIEEAIKAGELEEKIYQDLKPALQHLGFDGYHHTDGLKFGVDHKSHNVVSLFDNSKIVTKKMKIDRSTVPTIDRAKLDQQAKDYDKEENKIFYDPDDTRKYDGIDPADSEKELEYINNGSRLDELDVKSFIDNEEIDEALRNQVANNEQFKDLQELKQLEEVSTKVFKAAANCVKKKVK